MSEYTAVVLQARIGSSRLPGKVLAPIAGLSVLGHCIERLRHASGLRVIVATTTESEDDLVVEEARRRGAEVLRGPAEDVLARYAQAVSEFGLIEIVRATADNPAVDMEAPQRCLDLLRRTGADYVVERGLPYGAAVEAVSASAILLAADQATTPADREHVTTFIKRDEQFVSMDAIAPGALRRPSLRLTVDTPDDLDFMRRLYSRLALGGDAVPLATIIAAAERLLHAEAGSGGAAVGSTR